MAESPTIIERFLAEVLMQLRERGADGAARNTRDAAAIFEPVGRVGRRDSEQQRLVLLADRASRRWTPSAVATLRDGHLDAMARQVLPVRDADAAASAAELVGSLREVLRARPDGHLAATSTGVAQALAPLQIMLRQIADGDPTRPEVTAVTAVPHAARGLVACFYEGAAFADGIPGEARATVTSLDALDDEAPLSWGSRDERTNSESSLHRDLVRSLMSRLAIEQGQITHADDGSALPQPLLVGRHRPDLAGRTISGDLFLGEAKLGPELLDVHTQEQLADFLADVSDGAAPVLHLIVPGGWRQAAEAAARKAAGNIDRLRVYELRGLAGAPRPPHN